MKQRLEYDKIQMQVDFGRLVFHGRSTSNFEV